MVAISLVKIPDIEAAAGGTKVYLRRGIVLYAFDREKVWRGVPTETLIIA